MSNADKWNEEFSHSLATTIRVKEIESQGKIGLIEFIDLTGIGARKYGVYTISEAGVFALQDHELTDLEPQQQHALLRIKKNLSLPFPCAMVDFLEWYHATCGTNGISDFPLAPSLLQRLKTMGAVQRPDRPPVTSHEITNAFVVWETTEANVKCWRDRLADPKKYGLLEARIAKGSARRPSTWDPVVVASWLIERKLLSKSEVFAALARDFPEHDTDLLRP